MSKVVTVRVPYGLSSGQCHISGAPEDLERKLWDSLPEVSPDEGISNADILHLKFDIPVKAGTFDMSSVQDVTTKLLNILSEDGYSIVGTQAFTESQRKEKRNIYNTNLLIWTLQKKE